MTVVTARHESWRLARPFAISRGVKTAADVVVCEIAAADGHRGRGECVPYPRYGETVADVIAAIEGVAGAIADGLDREGLLGAMPAGAARNAVDSALWDLEARRTGRRAWQIAGLPEPMPAITAETVSIGTPDEMRRSAERLAAAPLIKVKLDADAVIERMTAVRAGAPEARLIVDPNEAWTIDLLQQVAGPLADLGVEMIEQPLPAGADDGLAGYACPVPVCADEACHVAADLDRLAGKYAMVNVKLDKTGGLTEAIGLARAALERDFALMVGCMVGTSLAMAPAVLLGPLAAFVDLDGPLLLKQDREPGLRFENGRIYPPAPELWG